MTALQVRMTILSWSVSSGFLSSLTAIKVTSFYERSTHGANSSACSPADLMGYERFQQKLLYENLVSACEQKG